MAHQDEYTMPYYTLKDMEKREAEITELQAKLAEVDKCYEDYKQHVIELENKIASRNTQIADLKHRLEHHQSLQGEITLKLNDVLLENKKLKHRIGVLTENMERASR